MFYFHRRMEPPLAEASLKALILTVRDDMTPMHGRIADYCLANPLAAGTMGIEELAVAADVSSATVNRFTRALGLDGFADFRALAVADIHRLMTQEEKLEAQAGHPQTDITIVEDSFDAALFDLKRTRETLDAATWGAAVEAIRGAGRVVLIGFGLAAVLVDLLADMIAPYCRAQIVFDGRGGPERILRRSIGVGAGDLVIAVTLPRYSQATLDHVAQMRMQGAAVLGITDAETSPLTPLCDLKLLAVSQHPLLHASPTAVVAIFEALYALLAARTQNPREAAEVARRIRPHLHIDPTPADPTSIAASRTTE